MSFKQDRRRLQNKINYHIRENGISYDKTLISDATTQKQLKKAESELNKAIYEGKRKAIIGELIFTTPKTINQLKDKPLSYLKTEKKKADAFIKDRDEFIGNVVEYNKTLNMSQMSNKISIVPTNRRELNRYKKGLEQAKNGDIEGAKKSFGLDKDDSLYQGTADKDEQKSRSTGQPSYKQQVYFNTCVKEARGCALPELANLFLKGGISLVDELTAVGFTIEMYSESANDLGYDNSRNAIISSLEDCSRFLSPYNKMLVHEFLDTLDYD